MAYKYMLTYMFDRKVIKRKVIWLENPISGSEYISVLENFLDNYHTDLGEKPDNSCFLMAFSEFVPPASEVPFEGDIDTPYLRIVDAEPHDKILDMQNRPKPKLHVVRKGE